MKQQEISRNEYEANHWLMTPTNFFFSEIAYNILFLKQYDDDYIPDYRTWSYEGPRTAYQVNHVSGACKRVLKYEEYVAGVGKKCPDTGQEPKNTCKTRIRRRKKASGIKI